MKDNNNPVIIPIIKIVGIIVLKELGNIIVCWGYKFHVIIIPNEIAVGLISRIGRFDESFEWLFKSGFNLISILLDRYIIRREYDAVIPIDKIINIVNKHSILDEIIFSIIWSFEKNPDVNGKAISAIFVIPKDDEIRGIGLFILIIRISWYDDSWIITPAHMNIKDLKKAWIIKWI